LIPKHFFQNENCWLSATNPESGTISYTYDNSGNLLTKQDARNIKTTYSYDQLSRVLTRSYELCSQGQSCQSQGTPTVTYTYDDSTVPLSKGKLTKVSSSISETRYTSFDALGRLLSNQQITDGATYPMSYTYNLAGALVSQTYPSGRVVTNTFDTDGQLSNVSSKANSTATPRTYANSFIYTAHGAVSSMRLGNGRFESTQFNSRLQPTQIALGTSANNTGLWRVNYELGELQTNGSVDTSKNNGNVAKQTIVVPDVGNNQGFTATQTYNYDSLDRLKQVKESVGSETKWQQTFLYDRYSNRRFDASQTTTLNQQLASNLTNPTADEQNNRFKQQDGYSYDSSGNMTQDAFGNRFNYEADGRTSKFFNSSNNTSQPDAVYFYDGESKRVKKVVGSVTTVFVYDAMGKMVAEYSNESANSTPTISYTTQDDYDNLRVMTNATGQITQRRDYMPFGEELIAGYGNRIEALGYTANQVRQGFAGQQKDDETGFNYFGERYYSPAHGRFTSPDTLMASGGASNPQTWNRYAYVVNNPIAYIDVNGQIRRDKNGKVKTSVTNPQIVRHPGGSLSSGFDVIIHTDKGRPIIAYQNSSIFKYVRSITYQGRVYATSYDSRQDYNCHGLTFTQGQLWINNNQVQTILEDDYKEVKLTKGEKPQIGDVVVYYDPNDSNASPEGIVHSATITQTDGTIEGTQVSGLGGIQQQSTTTSIQGQWNGSSASTFKIFRRRNESKNEPNAPQRAEIARNARKPIPPLLTTEPVQLQTTIMPRPLLPLPEPPKKP
jgi:RHS repeat-associated protein